MLKSKKNKKFSALKIKQLPLSVFGILFLTILISSFFFQKNQYRDYQYELNSITHESVIAPFTFPILKSDDVLKKERKEMVEKTPYVFKLTQKIQTRVKEKIQAFSRQIESLKSAEQAFISSKNNRNGETYIVDSLNYIKEKEALFNDFGIEKNSELSRIIEYNLQEIDKTFLQRLRKILVNHYTDFIININKEDIQSGKIVVKREGEELLEYPENLLTRSMILEQIKEDINDIFSERSDLAFALADYFFEANLKLDKKTTKQRQKEAINKVPISKGIVLENEKIVGANTKVTPEVYRKLQSLSKERAKRAEEMGGIRKYVPLIGDPAIFFGHIMLVGIIISFFITFLVAYKSEIVIQPKMTILIGSLIVFQVIFAFLFKYQFNISEYAIPITIAAMMLTILFDPKIGFVGTACISILLGTQIGGDVYFIINSIFVSSFAIYSVRKLRNRSQLFMSIIYILMGYFFSITITELLQFSSYQTIGRHLIYAGINGIVAPFLTYGLIGVIEKPFDITTDLTLLELADFNHPLLKRLSKNAPGTFAHCIQVGNLAEAAADAVGANALLARVGSYYHDVGKVLKPEYFVENQSYISNKHDNLAPNMSALIIINHVKEGQKLAKEYKLPKVVADFIPTHHGTTKVQYFLNRAQNQADDPEDINDADFEYPGPKPGTKETGIVMIVESIEAACRSIEKPTIGNIIKVIDMIIAKRLEEGQLNNCPLTFSDLNKIKGDIKENTGILPVLKSIYHLRPEYPEKEKKKEK